MRIRPSYPLWAACIALVLLGGPAQGADPQGSAQRKGSGLPIPRFASLRSDEVNVRTGPGTRYPVDWVFKRKTMPVEIVAEYENWRKIRDWQGASGWVHQSLLTGKRSFIIASKAASLHKTPAPARRGDRQARTRGDGRNPLLLRRMVPREGVERQRLARTDRHVGRL